MRKVDNRETWVGYSKIGGDSGNKPSRNKEPEPQLSAVHVYVNARLLKTLACFSKSVFISCIIII